MYSVPVPPFLVPLFVSSTVRERKPLNDMKTPLTPTQCKAQTKQTHSTRITEPARNCHQCLQDSIAVGTHSSHAIMYCTTHCTLTQAQNCHLPMQSRVTHLVACPSHTYTTLASSVLAPVDCTWSLSMVLAMSLWPTIGLDKAS